MARLRTDKEAPGALEYWQREVLLFGIAILDVPAPLTWRQACDWRNTPAARAAWRRHRRKLIDEAKPGARPWAWWVLDRGLDRPQTDEEQFRRLSELGAIDEKEKQACRVEKPWLFDYQKVKGVN